ncbi:MAG: pseudouridine synthase [Deltaproteobacteria bacterium]|nr:pseudouridine synthase [Deltaproteobacteria bacterium]MDQ3299028.1 pseudouridine synthase [Myxococcota bacterium]
MTTVAFHKPHGVLSRFTPDGSKWRTLAGFGLPKDAFPIGRLDADSEGLLILSSDKSLVDALMSPRRAHAKTYWANVERIPTSEALAELAAGVMIENQRTLPARVRLIDPPALPPRDPPIRFRKSVPDCWLELRIVEGRNRQVRRMTAAIGHPTLRLVRAAIGAYELGDLAPAASRVLDARDIARLLASPTDA